MTKRAFAFSRWLLLNDVRPKRHSELDAHTSYSPLIFLNDFFLKITAGCLLPTQHSKHITPNNKVDFNKLCENIWLHNLDGNHSHGEGGKILGEVARLFVSSRDEMEGRCVQLNPMWDGFFSDR